MRVEADAGGLEPWRIYGLERRWPEATGCVFVPKAIAAFSTCILDVSGSDIARAMSPTAAEAGGSTNDDVGAETAAGMAELFGTMLRDGLMTSYARPIGGSGTRRLAAAEWDHDGVEHAIATGMLTLPTDDDEPVDHWTFVDAHEFGLLLDVYAPPTSADPLAAMQERCDRLVEIVLESLVPIAARRGRRAAAAATLPHRPSRKLLDALFPNAIRQLDTDDQERLVQLAVPWLIERFKADPGGLRQKAQFADEAVRLLAPYMTPTIFRSVWLRAATGDHKGRREPGQRAGAGRDEAAGR